MTFLRDVEDSSGDLVDVLYFCSNGCYVDSLAILTDESIQEGGAAPCSVPEWTEDEDVFLFCASCGVRLNGPESPIVVNLIAHEVDERTGLALPVRDSWMIEREAWKAGAEHGRAVASWYFDGNTSDETYRVVLKGIEEGDPAVLDTFPAGPLSGEWADDPTPKSVLEDLEVDEEDDAVDDYLQAYEDGFYEASHDEIERTCLVHLPYDELTPQGKEIR